MAGAAEILGGGVGANEGLDSAARASVDRRDLMRDLAKLKVDSPKTVRDQMRDQVETEGNRKEKFFGSAKYKLPQKDVDEIRAMEPETAVASLDSDGFNVRWHEAEWYRDYLDSAKALVAMDSLLDAPTKAWVNTLSPVLAEFVRMADLSPRDFKQNYKSDITKLVKLYGKEAVYGPKGALNLLLGMNRLLQSGVDKRPNLKTIKIVLGTGRDAASKAKDRFVVVMKQNANVGTVQDESEEDRPVVPPVAPAPRLKSVGFPKPKLKSVGFPNPKLKSVGFPEPVGPVAPTPIIGVDIYKKYEISDDLKADFDGGRAAYRAWYSDNEKMRALVDPNMMEIQPGETNAAADARLSKLFDPRSGEVKDLFDEMDAFIDGYPTFFQDSGNAEVRNIKNLFMVVGRSLVKYTEKYVSASAQPEFSLGLYHAGILKHCGDINKDDPAMRKQRLPDLIESASYLRDHDENQGEDGKAKWTRLFDQYTRELAAL